MTGPVSVDASDWYYSERLSDRLKKDRHADTRPYRDAYLRHLLQPSAILRWSISRRPGPLRSARVTAASQFDQRAVSERLSFKCLGIRVGR